MYKDKDERRLRNGSCLVGNGIHLIRVSLQPHKLLQSSAQWAQWFLRDYLSSEGNSLLLASSIKSTRPVAAFNLASHTSVNIILG